MKNYLHLNNSFIKSLALKIMSGTKEYTDNEKKQMEPPINNQIGIIHIKVQIWQRSLKIIFKLVYVPWLGIYLTH